MQFSKDGKYLAAGGQEKIVRIWQVIETTEERSMHEKQQDALGQEPEGLDTRRTGVKLTAPVFRNEPIREYKGHTADILDLSWSKVCSPNLALVVVKAHVLVEPVSSFLLYGQNSTSMACFKTGMFMLLSA